MEGKIQATLAEGMDYIALCTVHGVIGWYRSHIHGAVMSNQK